jgi:hypothetical protein
MLGPYGLDEPKFSRLLDFKLIDPADRQHISAKLHSIPLSGDMIVVMVVNGFKSKGKGPGKAGSFQ